MVTANMEESEIPPVKKWCQWLYNETFSSKGTSL
jgi:hypothetical protein